jgi:hypothetical protein
MFTSARHEPKLPAPRTSTRFPCLGDRAPMGSGESARVANDAIELILFLALERATSRGTSRGVEPSLRFSSHEERASLGACSGEWRSNMGTRCTEPLLDVSQPQPPWTLYRALILPSWSPLALYALIPTSSTHVELKVTRAYHSFSPCSGARPRITCHCFSLVFTLKRTLMQSSLSSWWACCMS